MKFRFWHGHSHGPMADDDVANHAANHFAAHHFARHFGAFDKHHRDSRHRHGGGGDSRRPRSRMFEQGDLRFVILKLLAEKPAHGYEIIKAVEAHFGGAYAPSPGIVYPTLTLLEDQGLIEIVDTAGARKLYAPTEEGRAELARSTIDVERVFARMREYRQRYGGGPAPEILRAMENLQTALRLRLDRGMPDEVKQITSIIDGAARAIEEL